MVFDPSKAIKKMLGPGINVPKFGPRSPTDSDGDGIDDIMDCQPKNMFRQDSNKWKRIDKETRFPSHRFKEGTIVYEKSLSDGWFACIFIEPGWFEKDEWRVYYTEREKDSNEGWEKHRKGKSYGSMLTKAKALDLATTVMNER